MEIEYGSEVREQIFRQLWATLSPSIGYLTGERQENKIIIQGIFMPKEWAGKPHVLDCSDLEKAIKAREPGKSIVGIAAYMGQWNAQEEFGPVRKSRQHLKEKGYPDISLQIEEMGDYKFYSAEQYKLNI